MVEWIGEFQEEINKAAGNDFLKFNAVIWKPGSEKQKENDPRVQINSENAFPFLDTELYWDEDATLPFKVHLKPNQELKYLNMGSAHTPGCFKAITTGVCKRLAKLTTLNDKNKDKKLNELYPIHFKALKEAELTSEEEIPTLEFQQSKTTEELQKNSIPARLKKRRENDRKRSTFFKIGYCTYWEVPIHIMINDIKKKFPSLSWLRISMSYHRFNNLRELFQGDLATKLSKNLKSKEFEALNCNCRKNEKCKFDGKCRSSIVVYKAICNTTGKAYIGNTQQFVKKRIQQHVQDVKRLVVSKMNSDSFATHFGKLIPEGTEKKAIKGLVDLKVEIIWQGNPISCVKTFGTRNCKLCTKERLEIVKTCKYYPNKIINKCNEVYGACRHKPRFHRFEQHPLASTDESGKDEKSKKPKAKISRSTTTNITEDELLVCTEVGKIFRTLEPTKKVKKKCEKIFKQPTRYSERLASRPGKTTIQKTSKPAT